MHDLTRLASLALLALVLVACSTADEGPNVRRDGAAERQMLDQFLDETRWEKRLLLLSGPAAEVQQQMQELAADSQAVEARDIVVIDLTGDTAMERIGILKVRPSSSSVLQRFSIPEDRLQLTLVGKDGGVKERYSRVTKTASIWPLIDAMPMRQREQRERGK